MGIWTRFAWQVYSPLRAGAAACKVELFIAAPVGNGSTRCTYRRVRSTYHIFRSCTYAPQGTLHTCKRQANEKEHEADVVVDFRTEGYVSDVWVISKDDMSTHGSLHDSTLLEVR